MDQAVNDSQQERMMKLEVKLSNQSWSCFVHTSMMDHGQGASHPMHATLMDMRWEHIYSTICPSSKRLLRVTRLETYSGRFCWILLEWMREEYTTHCLWFALEIVDVVFWSHSNISVPEVQWRRSGVHARKYYGGQGFFDTSSSVLSNLTYLPH